MLRVRDQVSMPSINSFQLLRRSPYRAKRGSTIHSGWPAAVTRPWNVFSLAIAIQNLLWGVGQPLAGGIADRNPQWQLGLFGGVGDLGRNLLGGDHRGTQIIVAREAGVGVVGQRVGGHVVERAGTHRPRLEQRGLNAERGHLDRERFHQRFDRPLGRRGGRAER